MPQFDAVEAKILRSAVSRFRAAVRTELAEPIETQLRGYHPPELAELSQELGLVERQLSNGEAPFGVHEIHARLLKAVVTHQRRSLASDIDEPRRRTGHRGTIRYLEKELRILDQVVHAPWFSETETARIPRLTDYLSLRFAEQARGDAEQLPERVYDEKFNLLEAPTLFLPDLAVYRGRCGLRRVPVCVVYLDIDDFKDFNTRYSETRIDRDLLPAFMEQLEAHVFAHGHAYRFGGDEYVVLLPNTRCEDACRLVERFQASLRELGLPGIHEPLTVSAGVCAVGPDCILTDREALERANRAKNHAKAQGKDRVAWYRGELYREEHLACAAGRTSPEPRTAGGRSQPPDAGTAPA
ncbi:MAG: GGDEF domain-containing protein [Deltaproteobacteria bacterium]|nr:GGDEF domain-containing protein [Deltaproteobacteria bacterium]